MNFNDLNEQEKHLVIESYLQGWEETHDKDDLPYSEALNIFSRQNEELFLK